MGVILAVVFGAANAYLGLRVGMTVSASIPAAVISMGIIRLVMKKDSVLESNMVQTIGSAGESLAAGPIFTMPVLFLWAKEGITGAPNYIAISLISLCGGVLGVLFMIPLLDKAWGFGTQELSAPQASLMKMIVEGVMDGNLPWMLIFIGVFIALAVECLQIPVLPVAIGLYLPMELSTTIMIGGVIRWFVERKNKKQENDESSGGVLFCSGLIAGEGLVGILLAVLEVVGIDAKIDLSDSFHSGLVGGIILLGLMAFSVLWFAFFKKQKTEKTNEKS